MPIPEIHLERLTRPALERSARVRVWLEMRGFRFELPRVREATACDRLADKVLEHWSRVDG